MERMDRVAFLALLWFTGWTLTGDEIGRTLGMPGTGAVWGFLFALVSVVAWPWVLPDFVDHWLYDPPLEDPRQIAASHHESHWRVMTHTMFPEEGTHSKHAGIHRVFVVAGLWFLMWMIISALVSGMMSKPGGGGEAAYFGFFNGAWWALWTSFTWPWILPNAVDRWMYRY
jgi:hypothetical protein